MVPVGRSQLCEPSFNHNLTLFGCFWSTLVCASLAAGGASTYTSELGGQNVSLKEALRLLHAPATREAELFIDEMEFGEPTEELVERYRESLLGRDYSFRNRSPKSF